MFIKTGIKLSHDLETDITHLTNILQKESIPKQDEKSWNRFLDELNHNKNFYYTEPYHPTLPLNEFKIIDWLKKDKELFKQLIYDAKRCTSLNNKMIEDVLKPNNLIVNGEFPFTFRQAIYLIPGLVSLLEKSLDKIKTLYPDYRSLTVNQFCVTKGTVPEIIHHHIGQNLGRNVRFSQFDNKPSTVRILHFGHVN